MKFLVGDIGNTLTKLSLLNQRYKIVKSYSIETSKLKLKKERNKFLKKFLVKNLNKKILFSSVVPSVYKLVNIFFKRVNYVTIEIKQLNLKKIIKFKVSNVSKVGSDRIANAIGSYSHYKSDCLVIDFGTATTFDVVNKLGIYDGGVIAPGINLSIKTLNQFTALLPILKLKKTAKPYGKNTKDALNAGFLWGYQGLINNIIRKIILSSNKNYKIILTGGYAKLFKKYINKKSIIDENITIKGIMKIHKDLLK
tara:strand:+ start:1499 stop:2257 length:759 start_codon:yes stop_codon:yes gene_type:complete